jgi:transcriptional regulator with XRE-family HTH domain
VERKDKVCSLGKVDMARTTKAAASISAETKANGVPRAKATEDIPVRLQQSGATRRTRAAPEPELQLNEVPSKPALPRRVARTPLDQLDPTLVYVGNVVRKARKAKDLTQLQLAKICGFNSAAVFMLEAGRQNMTLRNLMTVAAKLDLKVGDLFPRSTPRTAAKLAELREVITDVKDRVQSQLRLLERVSKELDEEAGNID